MQNVVDVLKANGWPPATLVVVALLGYASFVLYQDHKELQAKWEALARTNLEANILATQQRKQTTQLLDKSLQIQDDHMKTLRQMEATRINQRQTEQQLTAAAIQALRQIAEKVDVSLQVHGPGEILQKENKSPDK